MRTLTLAIALALLLGGCMNRPARKDRSGEVSYNRRDLPPEQGLFSGPDGSWTIYRNNPDEPRCGASPDEEGACEDPPPGPR
jgi:hypothetical protein